MRETKHIHAMKAGSKQSHTPVSWKKFDARQDPRTDGIAVNAQDCIKILDADFSVIANVNPQHEDKVNIIAAAPEMLEELEKAVLTLNGLAVGFQAQKKFKLVDACLEQSERIERLISKARGTNA